MAEERVATNLSTKKRILIVDDHPIVRQGLARFLDNEPDVDVCGGAEGIQDGLQQYATFHPDLLVVDISLKDGLGWELIHSLRNQEADVRILVWSMLDEFVFAERVMREGAQGFVSKQAPVESVVVAIRRVLGGELYFAPQVLDRLLKRAKTGPTNSDSIGSLTRRELEVLDWLGRGLSNREIAAKMSLSHKTVEAYRESIKRRLDLKNGVELTRRAVQWFLEKR